MPSMISWLMSLPLVDQIPAHDRLVRDVDRLRARHREGDRVVAGRKDFSAKLPPPCHLVPRSHGDAAGERGLEMLRLSERPLGAWGRHLDREALEVVGEDLRDALAERVVDTVRMVDVDAEATRREQLDGEDLDTRH